MNKQNIKRFNYIDIKLVDVQLDNGGNTIYTPGYEYSLKSRRKNRSTKRKQLIKSNDTNVRTDENNEKLDWHYSRN